MDRVATNVEALVFWLTSWPRVASRIWAIELPETNRKETVRHGHKWQCTPSPPHQLGLSPVHYFRELLGQRLKNSWAKYSQEHWLTPSSLGVGI